MIQEYIASKQHAWAETTKKSELHRLLAIKEVITGQPEELWTALATHKPYSRLTTWTRVTQYYNWLIQEGHKNGPNHYQIWRQKNARVFKNCYVKTKPSISYSEAERLIKQNLDGDYQGLALQILHSGLRFAETRSFESNSVTGKGNKRRQIYLPSSEQRKFNDVGAQTFRRKLARIGLKPHDLRKLFLSRLVELGANPFELCEIAGWNSIETANSYIKVNNDNLKRLVERVTVP